MKKINALALIALLVTSSFFFAQGCSKKAEKKGAGEAAQHAGEEAGEEHGEHEEHEEGEEGEEGVVTLDEKQVALAGITTTAAAVGNIDDELQLTGEVGFDENRTAHVVPRVSGTMRKVYKNLGDTVRAGEVLAVIESSELGEAKSDYLEKKQALDQARFDLARTQTVRDNSMKMIAALNAHPSLADMEKTRGLDLGQHRRSLVSAYSELVFAEAAYQREKGLYEKKISSGSDYQEAENALKKAEAEFAAAKDEISFEVKSALQEKKRNVRSAELSLAAADRNLHLLGIGQSAINSVAARNGNHESLALYTVTAPFGGTIVEKHATVGEQAGGDKELFTVSDIETVWVIASVYEKDISSVREGQGAAVTVKARPGRIFKGVVKWVGDTIEEESRTLKIRIQISNKERLLKPGMFVQVALKAGGLKKGLMIPSSSVQQSKGKDIVFVDEGSGKFEQREVQLGVRSPEAVEVLSGVREGEKVVSSGNFILKSELEKAGVGDPHGH